jgi:hypothetical protein
MAEDITLTATLDAAAVDVALNQIVKRVGQMQKSSDTSMKKMGETIGEVTGVLQTQLKQFRKAEKEGPLTEKQQKAFQELREDILKNVEALELLIQRMRQAQKIPVQFDTGTQLVSRKQIRGRTESGIGRVRGERFEKELTAMLETAEGRVKQSAQAILADLQAIFNDPTIEGSKFNREIGLLIDKMKRLQSETKKADQQARDFVNIGGVPRVESRETRAFGDVEKDAKDFHDLLTGIMSRTEGTVRDRAATIREDLSKMMDDPKISSQQYRKELNDLEKELDDILDKEQDRQRINIEGGATGIGGRRIDVREQIGRDIAGLEGEQLEQQLTQLMQSSREIVARDAASMKADLQAIFQLDYADAERLQANVSEIQKRADRLEKIKPVDLATAEEISQMSTLNTLMDELAQAVTATSGTTNQQAQERIQEQQELANIIKANAERRGAASNKDLAAVKRSITEVRRLGRVYKEPVEAAEELAEQVEQVAEAVQEIDPISEKLDAKQALNIFEENARDVEVLLKSNNREVRAIATELKRLGMEAKTAFDNGEKEAKEFRREQEKLRNATREVADAFDEDIPSGTETARISYWKLGNTMDRVGVRGAGGAVQIVDALRGIPPAAVAGVLAIAALVAGIAKLIEGLTRLGTEAARAFATFVKGSVESARNIEVTDRQLGGLVRNASLGEGFRNLLLDKSFQVGLNLTGDFARVIVPLAENVDEVERAAEIAATLAHAFQETDENIANAIKQAAGGHFRPLIERFGLTEFEISKIKDAQDRVGEFTGVLDGLAEALERRGLDLEGTFGGTLQLLLGQLSVLREQIQITVGEPVRDALAEQLQQLFSLVEDRKDAFMDFFRDLGDTVGDVITTAGDVVRSLIGDITDADIEQFRGELDDLGESVEGLLKSVQNLVSGEDTNLVDYAIAGTNALQGLVDVTSSLVQDLAELKEGIDFVTDLDPLGLGVNVGDVFGHVGEAVEANLTAPARLAETLGKAIRAAVDPDIDFQGQELGREALEEVFFWLREDEKAAEDLEDAQDSLTTSTEGLTQAQRDEIDAATERAHRMRELEQLLLAAEAAQEKIDKAEAKLARDRALREQQINTRRDRANIDLDLKRSQQREDLFKKHMFNMLKLTDDFNFRVSEAGIQFDQKEEDIHQKHQDKLADIDRNVADKKIDIEKKFRERLKDIRAKFDLDAEEAIRRNDAVGLLRIRRRMKLELDQAKRQRDNQIKEADDAAEKRREDAKIWLERAVRDNDIAENRKLDDLRRADEQRRAQLIEQYNFEYAQIDTQYRRQRDAIAENQRRAQADLEEQFAKRREDLNAALEADYDTVTEWKDSETEYMELTLQTQLDILRAQRRMWLQEGTLFRHLAQNLFNPGAFNNNFYDPNTNVGSGGPSDRGEPIGGSVEADVDDPVGSGFRKQHGGYVTTGNVYGINERGTEAFYATRAGIIQSRGSLLESPYMRGGSVMNIDNSRMIQADINTTDPTHMSPIQRTMIKQMITEEMLSHGV